MVRLPAVPAGYRICPWCGHGLRLEITCCPTCGLDPRSVHERTPVSEPVNKPASSSRVGPPRFTPFGTTPDNKPLLGVDPGARYVGVVIRDGDVALHSSTWRRPDSVSELQWPTVVVDRLLELREQYGHLPIGVESVTFPKGRTKGQIDPINPAHLVFTAICVGAICVAFRDAIWISPGHNGSRHLSHYPPALRGSRAADLSGVTEHRSRDHERSAWDVAGRATDQAYPLRVPASASLPLASTVAASMRRSG